MTRYTLDDTIAAIATAPGVSGIGIIRISGKDSVAIADRIFEAPNKEQLKNKKSHTVNYGLLHHPKTKTLLDESLVLVMHGPRTFTGEDTVELQCHGGILVLQKVLEAVLLAGARLAMPGEFTKRRFLNGHMDLTQAEAVMDLLHAKTSLSQKSAISQLQGTLREKIHGFRDQLINIIASLEAALDYPEEDIQEETRHALLLKIQDLMAALEKCYQSANCGKLLSQGIETVILGKPNVGKSSLLNYLLQEERAIVTDIPGTTRDTVEETINLGEIPLRLVDTAGIRESSDKVEQLGVAKAKNRAMEADLLFVVLDSSRPLEEEDREIIQFVSGKKVLYLFNKSDLPEKIDRQELEKTISKTDIISISVKQGTGIEDITLRVKELFFGGAVSLNQEEFLGNARHQGALGLAIEALKRVAMGIDLGLPEDILAIDLTTANDYLGEITGDQVDEEIIDRIFTKFCLGK